MKKILILRGGALGDFLVTLPALRLLRTRWPQARLELAGNATAAALGMADGLLDAAYSQHEARWSELHRREPLSSQLAAWLGEFDLIINYWPDPAGELAGHFPLHPSQVFLTANASPQQAPAAAHYCEPLRALGLETTDYFHRLRAFSPTGRSSHRIALHPGSGSARKNWPIERWAEICRQLSQQPGTELLIVSGEAESRDILAGHGAAAHALPLVELAGRLANCSLFLGHDSGVSHLAAAVGVPSVLLFGPTDARIWAPPAPHVTVLQRGDELSAISVANVMAAIAVQAAAQTATASPPRSGRHN
jgi:heptosyltransferase-3